MQRFIHYICPFDIYNFAAFTLGSTAMMATCLPDMLCWRACPTCSAGGVGSSMTSLRYGPAPAKKARLGRLPLVASFLPLTQSIFSDSGIYSKKHSYYDGVALKFFTYSFEDLNIYTLGLVNLP